MAQAANIDPAEVARFARLAEQWWDPKGKFAPLHALAPARLRFIRDAIDAQFDTVFAGRSPLAGKTVLDVGCGGGLASEPLARLGGQVTGIDPSPETIGIAEAHAQKSGLEITYRATTAEEIAETGATFDVVVCLEVVEHVPDPAAFIATLTGLVAPGGCLILSTLNRTMKSYLLAIVGAEYVLGWLERGTHDWQRFLRPEELTRDLSACGFEVFEEAGIAFNPVTGTWKPSRDMDVNYMLAARHHGAGASV